VRFLAHRGNPAATPAHVDPDIFAQHRAREVRMDWTGFGARHADVSAPLRPFLLDWLFEVAFNLRLLPETFHLAVSIIDRFLCVAPPLVRQRLQLLGVTALLLASKLEEVYPPEVRDMVYVCDRAYTREQILDMERIVLSTLQGRLWVPTPFVFLAHYTSGVCEEEHELKEELKEGQVAPRFAARQPALIAEFLLALAVCANTNTRVTGATPSVLAAACVMVAWQSCEWRGRPASWEDVVSQGRCDYDAACLAQCVRETLQSLYADAVATAASAHPSAEGAVRVYALPRFDRVATLPLTFALDN
jgi:hypothetical protein